jgi:very-short-patch-repair endonuclease
MARGWTDKEKNILRKLLKKPNVYTYLQLADVLSRPVSGVQSICNKLNLQSNVKRIKSKGEEILFTLLREIYPSLSIEKQHPVGDRLHLDVYIQDLSLGFEYDGIQHSKENSFFHKNKDAFLRGKILDEKKDNLCASQGIHLIRIGHEEELTKDLLTSKIASIGPGPGREAGSKESSIKEKNRVYNKRRYELAKINRNNSELYQKLKEQEKNYRRERYLYLKSIKDNQDE